MSNYQIITLPQLDVHRAYLAPALSCIFHTIFFNRFLESTRRLDDYFLELQYPKTDNVAFEKTLKERCNAEAEKRPPNVPFEIRLTFEEHKYRRVFLLSSTTDRMPYEQWVLPVRILPDDTASSGASVELEQRVRGLLFYIIKECASKRDHLPPLVASSKTVYKYEFSVQDVKPSLGKAPLVPTLLGFT